MSDGDDEMKPTPPSQEVSQAQERRERVFGMRLAGASIDHIAKEEGISTSKVQGILKEALKSPTPSVEEMRALENARLDLLSTAMLRDGRKGSTKATMAYLRISDRRARLNGLDAPQRIQIAASVRVEMEQALEELEATLEQVIPPEIAAQRELIEEAEILDAEVDGDDDDDLDG